MIRARARIDGLDGELDHVGVTEKLPPLRVGWKGVLAFVQQVKGLRGATERFARQIDGQVVTMRHFAQYSGSRSRTLDPS